MEQVYTHLLLFMIFIIGGFVRLIDGSSQPISFFGYKPYIHTWMRNCAFIVLAYVSWLTVDVKMSISQPYNVFIVYFMLWVITPLVISISLIVGHTDWQDWTWQPLRFGLFGCGAVVMLNDIQLYWPIPVVMAIGGLTAPMWFYISEQIKLPTVWLLDGPEAYSRITVGGLVLSSPLWVLLEGLF